MALAALILIGFASGPVGSLRASEDSSRSIPEPDDHRAPLIWAVFAYRGVESTTEQYRPIADYLNATLTDYRVELRVLTMEDMYAGIEQRQFDVATTNPTHFLVVRQKFPLSGIVATLVNLDGDGRPVQWLAGVIVSRSDRSDLNTLTDIRGQRVAAPSVEHMGGYRAQVYEMHLAGLRVPEDFGALVLTGDHHGAIHAVLNDEADVALVRTGILELMVERGELTWEQVKVLNPRQHDRFDLACSTNLYPEWPVFAMPHADERGVRHFTSALLAMEPDDPAARAARIAGYTVPADYLTVEQLARALRLPPFDEVAPITMRDIWQQWRAWMIGGLSIVGVGVIGLVIWMLFLRWKESTHRQYAEQIMAASQAKSDFLANMSHEIRTPMGAILGYTDIIGDNCPGRCSYGNEGLREAITVIRRNGIHLMTIINDILDLSKIEAGKMTIEETDTPLYPLLFDIQSLIDARARSKGIALGLDVQGPLPESINSDPVRLRQILVNLVGNAVKFTEQGEVRISIQYQPDTADSSVHGRLQISVIDSGIGMSDEAVIRLFQSFSQADTSTTRRFGGTGLGLRISRDLAVLLGGDITVRSVVGEGSSFTLSLPVVCSDEVRLVDPREGLRMVKEQAGGREASDAEPVSLAGVRIFFAEDGPDNQRLIGYHLRKAQAEVTVFDNGLECLKAMTEQGGVDGPLRSPAPCDLVLTDMQMPEMDGYALARKLRALGWQGRIVALTAHAMSGDDRVCREAGCDDYLTKPVNRRDLIEMCRPGGMGCAA